MDVLSHVLIVVLPLHVLEQIACDKNQMQYQFIGDNGFQNDNAFTENKRQGRFDPAFLKILIPILLNHKYNRILINADEISTLLVKPF